MTGGPSVEVYISVDMEGVAGIATIDQVLRGGTGYARAQALMTDEANAAIAGAIDGGATSVLVNDSHGTMDNLLPHRLDRRARLVHGRPKADCMAEGISERHDVALFVGYHAAGGEVGVLAHTFSTHFGEVRLNGERVSESDVNALQLAAAGVPLGLVTGDDVTCERALRRHEGVRVAQVKQSHGWSAARSLPPEEACELIRGRARDAVRHRDEISPSPLPEILELEVDLPNQTATETALMIPGVERTGACSVRRVVDTPRALVNLVVVLYSLAAAGVAAQVPAVDLR